MTQARHLAQRVGMMMVVGKIMATRTDRGRGRWTMTAQVRVPETGELLDDVPILASYGVTTRPRNGSDCVVGFVGGNRAAGVVIALGDGRFNIGVETGEVGLHTHDGSYVILRAGGTIAMKSSTAVTIDSPVLRCTGDVIAGTVSLRHHRHPENGNGGGTTSEPIP